MNTKSNLIEMRKFIKVILSLLILSIFVFTNDFEFRTLSIILLTAFLSLEFFDSDLGLKNIYFWLFALTFGLLSIFFNISACIIAFVSLISVAFNRISVGLYGRKLKYFSSKTGADYLLERKGHKVAFIDIIYFPIILLSMFLFDYLNSGQL